MSGIVLFVLIELGSPLANAGPQDNLAGEFLERVMGKFGREVAQEGAETVARNLARLTERFGDDVLRVLEHTGPQGLRALESAGTQGARLTKLLANQGDDAGWLIANPTRIDLILRHGDDAVTALVRHRQIAEKLLEKLGQPAAKLLANLSPRNGRRLAILLEEGELLANPAGKNLLAIITEHGDKALDFIWRNKGPFAITACLAAFLHDPRPFLEGVRDLTQILGHTAMQPITEGAREVARGLNWTLILVLAGGVLSGWMFYRNRSRSPN